MKDHVTPAERLDFTTTGTRPYRGMPLDEQRARYEQERQRALQQLGRRWLLDPSHSPQRSTPLVPEDFEAVDPETDDDQLWIGSREDIEATVSEFYDYHYNPEPRG